MKEWNYLLAEGLKWAVGQYYDHQGVILGGEKAVELEKLRNARSTADAAASLERLKLTTEAVLPAVP